MIVDRIDFLRLHNTRALSVVTPRGAEAQLRAAAKWIKVSNLNETFFYRHFIFPEYSGLSQFCLELGFGVDLRTGSDVGSEMHGEAGNMNHGLITAALWFILRIQQKQSSFFPIIRFGLYPTADRLIFINKIFFLIWCKKVPESADRSKCPNVHCTQYSSFAGKILVILSMLSS